MIFSKVKIPNWTKLCACGGEGRSLLIPLVEPTVLNPVIYNLDSNFEVF